MYWAFIFTSILAIRYYDIGGIAFINDASIQIPLIRIFANGPIIGFLVALPYSFAEAFLKDKGLYRNSLGRIIFNRTLYLFIISSLVLFLLAYLNYRLDVISKNIDHASIGFSRYIFSPTVGFLFLGALVGNIILTLFRTLQSKIGAEELSVILAGKYRPPLEVMRAFMFLDLQASTTIAEQLGHQTYSRFIQDCFNDLHNALVATDATVYQYVGDEAVLTWPMAIAAKNNNFLEAYFIFQDILDSRSTYYQRTYGIKPFFKAGVNIGPVMAAEVGLARREIAYHGDVLNTAARIQSLCNKYNAALLCSEVVVNHMERLQDYKIVEKEELILRGKTKKVKVFQIEPNRI